MKFTYDREYEVYRSGGWEIEPVGGFITSRHYWVHNKTFDIHFWQSKLTDAKRLAQEIMENSLIYRDLPELYKKSLY